MKLFFQQQGDGQPIVILHGLFGSSDNWYSIAKSLASSYHVITVDLRNHGRSPHSSVMNYQAMSDDLQALFMREKIHKPHVIGHSMGGKVAMNFSIAHPKLMDRLVVLDIMPKVYQPHHDHIINGLESIRVEDITSRSQADEQLSHFVDEPGIRQFLLKNLQRTDVGDFSWRVNIQALKENIFELNRGLVVDGQFSGHALFVVGNRSKYFQTGDEQLVEQSFPNAEWLYLDAGHWVHAEQPKAIEEAILKFCPA